MDQEVLEGAMTIKGAVDDGSDYSRRSDGLGGSMNGTSDGSGSSRSSDGSESERWIREQSKER